MLNFFRKIRYRLMSNNQMGKYFKYALGEILLVVIGILIALQVNNWNEDRILKRTQNIYLKQLSADIDTMYVDYNASIPYSQQHLDLSRDVFRAYKSCELSPDQKVIFDQLLINYNSLGLLFEVRDTYEEMLSANLLANLEDKELKNLITEFFAQRDAMMIFIEEFKQDLNQHYKVIEEHVVFNIDSMNQSYITYNLSELCANPSFSNALYKYVTYRENLHQMRVILDQKLERMQGLLKKHNLD